jgi:membrane protein DedA with SNARE-associated domain
MFESILLSFDHLQDAVAGFVISQIYLAPVLLLILEEAGFPLPVTDFVIAYTGYQVSLGRIPFFIAYIMLLISDLIGASILFYLSKRYGQDLILKFGKYIHLDKHKVTIVEKKFRQYGPLVIILGRHIIGFRVPITVFSGISGIKYRTFLLSTFVSIFWWIPIYLAVGQKLGAKTIHLILGNHWYFLLIILPFIISFLPFFFMRKTEK